MRVIPSQSLFCRQGPPAWFTGSVWVDEVVTVNTPILLKAARVSFAPGARTAWHTHPLGQALHVLSGIGWVQLKGQSALAIRAGDSVWIEPGEEHWHGASADHTMVHLAMHTPDAAGTDAVWLEHVTDEEYGGAC